jgi:hypothetical protein
VRRIYQAEGGARSTDGVNERQIASQNPYPPSAFLLSAPFALLPLAWAQILWLALTMGSFVFAAYLLWNLAEVPAPTLVGCLIGFLLANSEVLAITGNAAGLVISLCVVAVWCFVRERFIPAGILCFALSLAIKPHDTGLIWLYFLLAGGVYRKRAWQTLGATIAISLPMLWWVWRVSPGWLSEMRANIASYALPGGINDPGLASTGGHGLDMLVSLQTAVSFFRDDPHVYNRVSYLICVPLLVLWAWITVRGPLTRERVWLGLAAIAALSLLPIYHRQLDTKILLLTVPACALLWAEGGRVGRLALLVTGAGFVGTADIPWAIVLGLISHHQLPTPGFMLQVVVAVQFLPVPLVLLAMGVFYLWAYGVRGSGASAGRNLEADFGRGSE